MLATVNRYNYLGRIPEMSLKTWTR